MPIRHFAKWNEDSKQWEHWPSKMMTVNIYTNDDNKAMEVRIASSSNLGALFKNEAANQAIINYTRKVLNNDDL